MRDINKITELFEAHRNEERAAWHFAYLRRQFPFLGIQQPLRKRLQAPFLKHLYTAHEEGEAVIQSLWNMPEREYLYVAMDVLSANDLREKDFPLLEQLIQEKSWWDTVDVLASNHVGKLCKKFPALLSTIETWLHSRNLWLRRSALLFQLRYKHETDEERLFSSCIQLSQEKEFFIQRAIAWALREYAKTFPKSVNALFKKTIFSNLVLREVKPDKFF